MNLCHVYHFQTFLKAFKTDTELRLTNRFKKTFSFFTITEKCPIIIERSNSWMYNVIRDTALQWHFTQPRLFDIKISDGQEIAFWLKSCQLNGLFSLLEKQINYLISSRKSTEEKEKKVTLYNKPLEIHTLKKKPFNIDSRVPCMFWNTIQTGYYGSKFRWVRVKCLWNAASRATVLASIVQNQCKGDLRNDYNKMCKANMNLLCYFDAAATSCSM